MLLDGLGRVVLGEGQQLAQDLDDVEIIICDNASTDATVEICERFAAGEQRSAGAEQRKKIAELERALGRKTYELEIAGKLLRDWE